MPFFFSFPARLVGTHQVSFNEITTGSANYSVIELELTALVCKIHGLSQLLKHHYFEVSVDHKVTENLSTAKKEMT